MRSRVLATLIALTCVGSASAAEPVYEAAGNDVSDVASLQRGAKYFVNYCLGCHAAEYVRYNTLAEGLQLTEAQLVENLMFTGERPFDTMQSAMPAADAERWFGIAPPDLSLISRSRGTGYIYNYLRGFYQDESTATGANNVWLPNTAMPHVLWPLQGIRRPIYSEPEDPNAEPTIEGFELVEPGQMTAAEFDQAVRDIVNFLDYIGEPMQLERRALGLRVIAFLLVFLVLAVLLKKEIWKDVK